MHSALFFLLESADPQAPDKDVLADLVGTFENGYVESYCDENNWYRPELALLRNGRLILDAENSRGDLGLQACAVAQRWSALMRQALLAVAEDFLLFDADWTERYPNPGEQQLAPLPNSAIVRAIRTLIPARLSAAYAQAEQTTDFQGNYNRLSLARGYEVFRDCTVVPFSRHYVSPYENYGCFDLRSDVEPAVRPDAAILVMDVHA